MFALVQDISLMYFYFSTTIVFIFNNSCIVIFTVSSQTLQSSLELELLFEAALRVTRVYNKVDSS